MFRVSKCHSFIATTFPYHMPIAPVQIHSDSVPLSLASLDTYTVFLFSQCQKLRLVSCVNVALGRTFFNLGQSLCYFECMEKMYM